MNKETFLNTEEEEEEEDDDDFIPDQNILQSLEDKNNKPKLKQEINPLDNLIKKRSRDKVSQLWEEMNSPNKKKQKIEKPIIKKDIESPKPTTGSRFSFSSPKKLIEQAQKAKEITSNEQIDKTKTMEKVQYEFAGEKVEIIEEKSVKKGNLDDIIDSLQTKKISTLQKSKIDWDKYKTENKIEEELQYHNKDGYLEKVAFKQRTEQRVHENQKKCRTQNLNY